MSLFPKPILINKLVKLYLTDSDSNNYAALLIIRYGKVSTPFLFSYAKKYPLYLSKLLVLIEKLDQSRLFVKFMIMQKTTIILLKRLVCLDSAIRH